MEERAREIHTTDTDNEREAGNWYEIKTRRKREERGRYLLMYVYVHTHIQIPLCIDSIHQPHSLLSLKTNFPHEGRPWKRKTKSRLYLLRRRTHVFEHRRVSIPQTPQKRPPEGQADACTSIHPSTETDNPDSQLEYRRRSSNPEGCKSLALMSLLFSTRCERAFKEQSAQQCTYTTGFF